MSSITASQAQIKEQHFADANLNHFYIESSFLAIVMEQLDIPKREEKKIST